ncbi:MAG: rhodanese-like domain-containing protein [Salinivirgaceae bacterium]|nr:rhodanese-like domain-containing protein [Salinivirgaceae bacterium]
MEYIFENKGFIINNLKHLSAKEAYECSKQGAIFIDVREEFMSHMKTFDVPEILISPLKNFSRDCNKLPKDKFLVFVDATGVKSKPAMETAAQNGYSKIANLAGGLVEWERDGMPTNTYQKIIVSGSKRCEFVDKNRIR